MRAADLLLSAAFSFALSPLIPLPAVAQQPAATATQALTLLQSALRALSPATPVTDVTLTGTARRIAGSDDESGTVTLKFLASVGSRLDLSLSSGNRSEVRNTSGATPIGSWSGPDGVSHAIANHNLFTEPGYFPALTLSALLSAPNAVVTYVGPETRNGQSVLHVTASQQFPDLPGDVAALMRHLSQVEVFLDSSTLLPAAILFNIHPDNNALLDIPVELRFSDYRSASGAQVPYHVQRFINNGLALDLQFDSVTFNSGLSTATFEVQ
jgi:hypothetical protein